MSLRSKNKNQSNELLVVEVSQPQQLLGSNPEGVFMNLLLLTSRFIVLCANCTVLLFKQYFYIVLYFFELFVAHGSENKHIRRLLTFFDYILFQMNQFDYLVLCVLFVNRLLTKLTSQSVSCTQTGTVGQRAIWRQTTDFTVISVTTCSQ